MSTEALGKRPTRVYNSGVEEAKRLRGTSDLSWWYEEENEDVRRTHPSAAPHATRAPREANERRLTRASAGGQIRVRVVQTR